jgi:di/tricarboxylate transporter
MIFVLAAATSAVGPGGILATALIAPFAMSAGARIGQTPFLISLMVGHGAMAGFLSPFSTTGAVAGALMEAAGLAGHQYRMWAFQGAAHTVMASAAYLSFGGFRASGETESVPAHSMSHKHVVVTLLVSVGWIIVAAVLGTPLGWSAMIAGAMLCLLRAVSPRAAVKRMPWKMIALVTAISSAVGLLDRAGGLEWFRDALTWVATTDTIHAAIAFFGGVISAYSSTTAVVMPRISPDGPRNCRAVRRS